jgi:hypothetical protein
VLVKHTRAGRTYTSVGTHHEEGVLAEAEAGHHAAAVIHGDLDEALSVLQIQHVLVIESSLQNLLDPANNEAHGVSLLELARHALLVAADCSQRT